MQSKDTRSALEIQEEKNSVVAAMGRLMSNTSVPNYHHKLDYLRDRFRRLSQLLAEKKEEGA